MKTITGTAMKIEKKKIIFSTSSEICDVRENRRYFAYTILRPMRQLHSLVPLADPRGAAGARPPATGSISFVFAYVFTEKCMRRRLAPPNRSAPPNGKSWIRHCLPLLVDLSPSKNYSIGQHLHS